MKTTLRSILSLAFMVMLPMSSSAQTETTLSFENFSIEAGKTSTLTIDLNNPNMTVWNMQFDMILSEGLSVAKDEDGYFNMFLKSARAPRHTIDANEVEGVYYVLIYTSNAAGIKNNSGALATIDIMADENFKTGSVVLLNIQATNTDNAKFDLEPVTLNITADPTSIKGVAECAVKSTEVYDLSGRRVKGQAAKGVYIVGGRKVVK